MSSVLLQKTKTRWDWKLWLQWIVANAVSETLGLGGTLLIGAFLLFKIEQTIGAIPSAGLAVLAGTLIEGLIVGTAQWLILHRPLKQMKWRTWALATAWGACVAWTLGIIPSTLSFTGPATNATGPGQMSDLMVYALAAAMGLVLGPILGVPQWLAVRHHLPKAGWWVPANAVAWIVGMVVIFVGTSFIPPEGITLQVALVLLLFVVMAGAAVGAIHGLVLVWLLSRSLLGRRPTNS